MSDCPRDIVRLSLHPHPRPPTAIQFQKSKANRLATGPQAVPKLL